MRASRLFVVAVGVLLSVTCAHARSLSDSEVREAIIKESIASYQASGRPCACPYNLARNGSQCGGRSAHSRPGGASPKCYPQDVSDADVAEWRRRHGP